MKRNIIHTLWAAALLLTACTQEELADDNRLPEGEYPVVIRATGLSVEATPQAAPSTRATVDGDWQGVTSVALKLGDAVKEYTVTAWWPFDNADITQMPAAPRIAATRPPSTITTTTGSAWSLSLSHSPWSVPPLKEAAQQHRTILLIA